MTTLLGYAHLARTHWQEHCPRLFQELETTGQLEAALTAAEERTLAEMIALQADFRRQGLTPAQAHQQAWELVRERYLLLPPETAE